MSLLVLPLDAEPKVLHPKREASRMEADILNLTKLFELNRRYLVPLYQRPYVWKEDTHWQPLWQDVEAVAERVLGGEPSPRAHFIGAVVLEQLLKATGEVETRLVIDGQQRLTTLQLLLESFADVSAARGMEKIHSKLVRLTRNDDLYIQEADEKFKVWPTAVDQEPFRTVMLHSSADDVRAGFSGNGDSRIPGAYLFFTEAIEEWLDLGEGDPAQRAEALYRTLRELIRLVVVDLAPDDDAQAIFETLNARGEPLRPSDLVKNVLLQRARDQGAVVADAYRKYWKPFDDQSDYWGAEVGRGHSRRPRIDIFLQHFLTVARRKEIAVGHLYAEFREYLREKTTSAIEHMAALSTYAGIYARFDDRGTAMAVFFDRLRTLEVGTAFPFLLELFHRHHSTGADIIPVLSALESFLVRRMVCHLNTRGYNRFFLDLLAILDAPTDELASRLTSKLLEGKADSNRWPTDPEFRQAWLAEPIYERQPQPRVRMLLEALERQLHSKHTERVNFGEKLTIEHLLPQDWDAYWPLPADAPAERRTDRNRELQTLGNLTLLTDRLNPKVSNGPWSIKKEALQEHSVLMLNRQVVENEDWNELRIRQRGDDLFRAALLVWPRPADPDAARLPVPQVESLARAQQNGAVDGRVSKLAMEEEHTNKSTVDAPTKLVWQIANAMIETNPHETRKAIIAECVRRGVAPNTARTQYYLWQESRRGPATGTSDENTTEGPDFALRSTTKRIITELRALGLDDRRFRLLHHFPPDRNPERSRLQDHLAYCGHPGGFSPEGTNVETARRLAACLARLQAGGTWDEALRDALQRFPLAGRSVP